MQTTIHTEADHALEKLQETLAAFTADGRTVALVPTMGALHEGHLELIRLAGEYADVVVVSIFVNPKQFGPKEDFARYPRMLEEDVKKAVEAGAHFIYAPEAEELYPAGFDSSVSAGALSTILEGKSRPGHFDGVATVVTKLLLRILPHVAIFGEKDYQQLAVIRRFVADLDIPVDIIGAPIVRETDGLAMSSRNVYLSAEERAAAPALYATLQSTAQHIASGKMLSAALRLGVDALTKAGFKVDYLELRHADTLAPMDKFVSPARLLVAANLGKTRLIDNIAVE